MLEGQLRSDDRHSFATCFAELAPHECFTPGSHANELERVTCIYDFTCNIRRSLENGSTEQQSSQILTHLLPDVRKDTVWRSEQLASAATRMQKRRRGNANTATIVTEIRHRSLPKGQLRSILARAPRQTLPMPLPIMWLCTYALWVSSAPSTSVGLAGDTAAVSARPSATPFLSGGCNGQGAHTSTHTHTPQTHDKHKHKHKHRHKYKHKHKHKHRHK